MKNVFVYMMKGLYMLKYYNFYKNLIDNRYNFLNMEYLANLHFSLTQGP